MDVFEENEEEKYFGEIYFYFGFSLQRKK